MSTKNRSHPAAVLDRRRLLGLGAKAAAVAATGPALLTSCGTKTDQPMVFWNFYAPVQQDDKTLRNQSKWFEDLAAEWNDTQKRKVKLQYIPGDAYQNGTKLSTAFAANQGPDIFLISPGDFIRYYNGGVLQDITPHLDKGSVQDFVGESLNDRSVGDKVYGLPMEIEPLAMFYGKEAWEKAGLSEADIPKTWDELLDVAQKLTKGSQSGVVFETQPGYFQNFVWYPWMWEAGGGVFNADQTESTFDHPGPVKALKLWQDAITRGVAPRVAPAAGDVITGLTQGLAGMWHSGIWNVASFRDNNPDFEYDVFRVPVPDGGKYVTTVGGWAFVANAKGVDPESAAEFCAFALGKMDKRTIERVADWCVGAKTDVCPRKSAEKVAVARGGYDSPVMKKFKDDIAPGAKGEPRYPPVVYKAISDAIQGSQLAGQDPQRAATTAKQAIDAYLETYEGPSMV